MTVIISTIDKLCPTVGAVNNCCVAVIQSFLELQDDCLLLRVPSRSDGAGKYIKGSLRLLLRMVKAMLKSERLVLVYPTIPFYPATSKAKYHFAKLLYSALYFLRSKGNGKLVVCVIDLPKEQEEGLNLKRIAIDKQMFLKFENNLLTAADKVILYSSGFEEIMRKRACFSRLHIATVPIGYCPYNQELINSDRQDGGRTRIFYSGEMSRAFEKGKLQEIINQLTENECLVVCGRDGDWLTELGLPNVDYRGYVDSATHDSTAAQCDFGLIIYPNSGYYQYVTPAKMNSYISMKLPILAIETSTIKRILDECGVGEYTTEDEIADNVHEWCEKKTFARYREMYDKQDFHQKHLAALKKALEE